MDLIVGLGIQDMIDDYQEGTYCYPAGLCDEDDNVLPEVVARRENTWDLIGLDRDENDNDIVLPFDPELSQNRNQWYRY